MNKFTWLVGCLAFTSLACGGNDGDSGGTDTDLVVDLDKDDDGYEVDVDCDDEDPAINPGADEVSDNGKDDDCDFLVDEILIDPGASLQEAIDAAPAGASLEIPPGTYNGYLTINKDVKLGGQSGAGDVILDGAGVGTLVIGGANDVTLSNITLQNSQRAVDCVAGKITIANSIIKDNGVAGGAGLHASACEINVVRTVFDNNHASKENGPGGAIYAENGSIGNITGSEFTNNTSHQGGAVNFTESVVGLVGNKFTRNTVFGLEYRTNHPDGFDNGGLGGALYTNGDGEISNNEFIENFGEFRGGAVVVDEAAPTIKGNTFKRNQSQSDGGGLFLNVGSSLIEDNLFEDNYTLDDGAALNCKGGDDGAPSYLPTNFLRIVNNRFINNRSLGDGGAIKASHGENEFVGNLFLNNKSASRGGAIEIDDEINHPTDGTASKYSSNMFIGNQAGANDASVWPNIPEESIHPDGQWSHPQLLVRFFADIPTIVESLSPPTVIGTSTFGRPSDIGIGGAINIWDSLANFELSNNLLVGNSATYGGGGIHTHRRNRDNREPEVFTFTNNTIVNNSAPKYATAWFEGSEIRWNNNIVAGNTSGMGYTNTEHPLSSDQSNNVATSVGFTYNNIFPYLVDGIASQIGTNGNISEDPLFTDSAADDFTLTSGSPSKDSGDPALKDRDNSRADMGAYGGSEGMEE